MPDGAIAQDGGTDGVDGKDGYGHDGYEACVPVDQISTDGVPPQVGDNVDFSIGGTVTKVTGQMAYVKVEDINGEAVKNTDGMDGMQGPNESTAAMGARLRGKAAASTDGQGNYGGY